MKKIIILNGKPMSGKDTFADYCGGFVKTKHISSVDLPKEIALKIGWNGIKDEAGRLFLSNLKKALTECHDIIFKDLKNRVEDWRSSDAELLFIDIREPDEIKRAVKEFDAMSLFVDRDVPDVTSNNSDKNVGNYEYDFTVSNNGTLDDLKYVAFDFVELMKFAG